MFSFRKRDTARPKVWEGTAASLHRLYPTVRTSGKRRLARRNDSVRFWCAETPFSGAEGGPSLRVKNGHSQNAPEWKWLLRVQIEPPRKVEKNGGRKPLPMIAKLIFG